MADALSTSPPAPRSPSSSPSPSPPPPPRRATPGRPEPADSNISPNTNPPDSPDWVSEQQNPSPRRYGAAPHSLLAVPRSIFAAFAASPFPPLPMVVAGYGLASAQVRRELAVSASAASAAGKENGMEAETVSDRSSPLESSGEEQSPPPPQLTSARKPADARCSDAANNIPSEPAVEPAVEPAAEPAADSADELAAGPPAPRRTRSRATRAVQVNKSKVKKPRRRHTLGARRKKVATQTWQWDTVLAEFAGQYVVKWKGNDPKTKLPWAPTLEPREQFDMAEAPSDAEAEEGEDQGPAEQRRGAGKSRRASGGDEDDAGADTEADVDDAEYDIRRVMDTVAFEDQQTGETLTLYLVDWTPGTEDADHDGDGGTGAREWTPSWELEANVSAAAIQAYKEGQK